jgi:hypothetical protein
MDGPHDSITKERKKEAIERKQKKESGFSKEAQNEDRSCVVAERVNKTQNAKFFIIEGSDPWKYWAAEMSRRNGRMWTLTCEGSVNGRRCRGWYFPSLYPPAPKPAAPPGELSDADAREFAGA